MMWLQAILMRCSRKCAFNLVRTTQQINSFNQHFSTTSLNRDKDEGPPELPSTCCMSGEERFLDELKTFSIRLRQLCVAGLRRGGGEVF